MSVRTKEKDMKTRVRTDVRNMWSKQLTANRFFRKMTYLFDHFEFIHDRANPTHVLSGQGIKGRTNYTRIFFNNENVRPDTKNCDWCMGTDYEDEIQKPHYFRVPNYVKNGAGQDLIKPKDYDPEKILASKTKFCAFVYAHNITIRNQMFDVLNKYKRVDSPGNCRNNAKPIGGYKDPHSSRHSSPNFFQEKIDYLKPYKFVISFENSAYPGYTTEKIYHAMLANAIPIYWGNPEVCRDFNGDSFVHPYHKGISGYSSVLRALLDQVAFLDSNDEAYLKMLAQPWLPNNQHTRWTHPQTIISSFKKVFSK